MPEPIIPPEGGAQSVEKLAEQVENLNKGIASYRDKVSTAEKAAEDARKEASEAKAEIEKIKKGSEGKKDEESNLNPDDQKKLEAWAKKNGFVTKDELEQEKGRLFNESLKNIEVQAIDEFVKTHPEYEEEANWDKVKKEFSQYKQPTSITGYRQILAKIHKEFKGSDEADAKARAAEETRKRLGLGGGGQSGAESDTTLESLRERYPNLSTDQISARLEEINTLAKAREERNKARKK